MATVAPAEGDERRTRRRRGDGRPRKNFPCQLCEKAFNSVEKLKVHSYSHTGERPYRCSHQDCTKAFVSKYKLLRHMATHSTEKTHKCTYCEKMFHRKDHLKNHLHTHDPNKEAFACDECGKSYNTKLGFKRHRALHAANSGDLTCQVCLRPFASTTVLLEHLRAHAGKPPGGGAKEKKHRCEHCDRRFYTRKDVRRHMVVHTGRKDFLCQYCAQRFGRKDHLTRHVKKSHARELLKVKMEPPDLNNPLDAFSCGASLSVKDELMSMMAGEVVAKPFGLYGAPHNQAVAATLPLTLDMPASGRQHPLKYQLASTSYASEKEQQQQLKGELESYLMELQSPLPQITIPPPPDDVPIPAPKLDLGMPEDAVATGATSAASDALTSPSLDFSQLFNFLPLNGPQFGQSASGGTSLGAVGYIQEEVSPLSQLPVPPPESLPDVPFPEMQSFASSLNTSTPPILPRFHQAFQ